MKHFFSQGKYNAVPTVVDNIRFASKKEARRYGELKMLEMAHEISGLQLQVRFPLVVEGDLIATYVADFCYVNKDGKSIVEDTKGYITAVYRLKKKLMKALHGIWIVET